MPRKRRMHSVANELITKSREAALAAVQIFNSPLITFKSEIFIVLMNVAWTYLLHAHYRKTGLEYRYFEQQGKRRVFSKTASGADKYWELERCLNESTSPVDQKSASNLRFLIGIRHEIEHRMTSRIDASLSAKFQACCLNYNAYVKELFGDQHGIDRYLSLSLQFSSVTQEQRASLPAANEMPSHIKAFILGFEEDIPTEVFNSPQFAYRVLFVAKTANHKGQADQVIEFVKADSPLAQNVNAAYTVIKETERPKYLPNNIVRMLREEGYSRFNMQSHTVLWQQLDAKNLTKGYGIQVQNTWYWYESWVGQVRKYCKDNPDQFKN